jgi:hypothetical protein
MCQQAAGLLMSRQRAIGLFFHWDLEDPGRRCLLEVF